MESFLAMNLATTTITCYQSRVEHWGLWLNTETCVRLIAVTPVCEAAGKDMQLCCTATT